MGKIIRQEFLGSRVLFFLLCLSIIGIPLAVLYFTEGMVRVEEELDDPTRFLEAFRSGKIGSRTA